MATKFSTQVARGDQARNVYVGLQTAVGVYNANGDTLSASDVIQMVKVPQGAIILNRAISGDSGAAAVTVKIGDGGDDDRYGTVTMSATAQFLFGNAATGHAYQISLSDDAQPFYETIDLTIAVASSVTVTCSIVLSVTYFMPPMSA